MVEFTCGGNSLDLKGDEKPDSINSEKEVHKAATYVNQ